MFSLGESPFLAGAYAHGASRPRAKTPRFDLIPTITDHEFLQALADPPGSFNLEACPEVNVDERMYLNPAAASILASATQPPKNPPMTTSELLESQKNERRNLYVELPLLRTDHESDVLSFTRRPPLDLEVERRLLPLEDIDDEVAEGGPKWPTGHMKGPEELWESLENEKLIVNEETMNLLSEILNLRKMANEPRVFEGIDEMPFPAQIGQKSVHENSTRFNLASRSPVPFVDCPKSYVPWDKERDHQTSFWPSSAEMEDLLSWNPFSSSDPELQTEDGFSFGSLERFMDIRKGLFPGGRPSRTQTDMETTPHGKRDCMARMPYDMTRQTAQTPPKPRMPWQYPQPPIPPDPRYFIVSEDFLQDRKLARSVHNKWPSANIIARELQGTAFSSDATKAGQQMQWPYDQSMNIGEVDIILSARTGLFWTTLQHIRQRPLPGQGSYSTIQDRTVRAAFRYERLLILISQNRDPALTRDPDEVMLELCEDDLAVVQKFDDFCSAMQDDVQTAFVYGGKEELASRIVTIMIEHSVSDVGNKFHLHETPAELFLRRAGLNAFAAQLLLTALQEPHGELNVASASVSNIQNQSLRTFVNMSHQERLASFEVLLGGRKLLENVRRVVDAGQQTRS